MRGFFWLGLTCVMGTLASCTSRQFNSGSEAKDVKDILSMQADGDGKFTVHCKDGRIESGVADDAIKRGYVCKPVTQVNPLAFNAYNLWLNGEGESILDYPANYDDKEAPRSPDGTFFLDGTVVEQRKIEPGLELLLTSPNFQPVVTEGVRIKLDVTQPNGVYFLTYPEKNGRNLQLKFLYPYGDNPQQMSAVSAKKYCQEKGMRLPTLRELFDFCAAGQGQVIKGDGERAYENKLCSGYRPGTWNPTRTWSATRWAPKASGVWSISGIANFVWPQFDSSVSSSDVGMGVGLVACVGASK